MLWIKVLLGVVFVIWSLFIMREARRTNMIYYRTVKANRGKDSGDFRRKLMIKHLGKVFKSLLVFVLVILLLIFVESRFD